jgi:hypothetical protein
MYDNINTYDMIVNNPANQYKLGLITNKKAMVENAPIYEKNKRNFFRFSP